MIPDAIWTWLYSSALWLVQQLPVIEFNCASLEDMSGYLTWVGAYVDLSTAGAVLGTMLATEALIWAAQALVWIWNKIPLT